MKIIFVICLVISCALTSVLSQSSSDRVKFVPENPNQNQHVKFCYQIDSRIFSKEDKVFCKIFFTGIDVVENDFPKVFEPDMQEENGMLCGSFDLPANSTGAMVVFTDSLKVKKDNNNGEGYWSPVFKEKDLLPGSLSGIADLYAGFWPPQYHLDGKKDVARKLYERDFELHPEIKRKFTRYYLATFDVYDTIDKQLFKRELNRYAQYKDLDEGELYFGVKRYYTLINEVDSAKKYEKLTFERYPNGSWALQVNSLKPAMQIDTMKDFDKKLEKYKEFQETYCRSYPDEETRLRMNNRQGQLLMGMVLQFAQNKDLDTWENEVEKLGERSKYYTYKRTAAFIAAQQKSASSMGMSEKGSKTGIKLETPVLRFKSPSDEQLILYAEKLARESTTWYRQNLNAPRGLRDRVMFTDKEIQAQRKEYLAMVLDDFSQSLMLQNRLEEAREILKEAVDLSKRTESAINEHYIESLVKTNQIDQAAEVIRLGKSTVAINNFYQSMVKDTSAKDVAMTNLRTRLKKQMTNEEMPEGILLNDKGEKITLKELNGKTIVIDFWATWCVPCLIGMESGVEVVEKYKGQSDVVFLFVNTERITDETKERVD